MVDGVLASCYPSADHDMAHLGMTPIRWFPEMIEGIFGVEDGFSVFAKVTVDMAALFFPSGHFFFKVFGGHMSFFGATGTPVLDFWTFLLNHVLYWIIQFTIKSHFGNSIIM